MLEHYHPTSEKLVDIMCAKTQNQERLFFRVLVAYYWGVLASQMRATIHGFGSSKEGIPINVFALNTSPSGTGKGFSTTLMDTELLTGFKNKFFNYSFNNLAKFNLEKLAQNKADNEGLDFDNTYAKYEKEFYQLGSPELVFDSGTVPAVKQLRQKLLMANVGSLNLQIDEIGANLTSQKDLLILFLELYDKGYVKEKLTKSTKDEVRFEKIEGPTPANLLMFGTPSKLLDGGQTEHTLYELLEMGYARRCLFGFVGKATRNVELTAEQVFQQMFNHDHDDFLEQLNQELALLADMQYHQQKIKLPESVCLKLIEYRLKCEKKAQDFKEHEVVLKSEMEHRYFKALKIAGAYCFIDCKTEITEQHLEYAIQLVEDSGLAFIKLMTPDRDYVRIAKHLVEMAVPLTLADLDQDLPYFRGSKQHREELINLAIAWGYKNNTVVKKSYDDGVLFLSAESLKPNDLKEIIVSSSTDMTEGYENLKGNWEDLHDLVAVSGYHWLNHHLIAGDVAKGYRKEENCLTGFNVLVIDIDGTCQLSTAKLLLQKYKALYYTTKRHTEETNRFRVVLPMNYTLHLDAKEYKEFFNNIKESLPFEIDEQCNHRSKKWLSHGGYYEYTEGELFDVLPYIPKTSKNEERQQNLIQQYNLEGIERWVLNNIGEGNRNNQLFKYAMILFDNGNDLPTIIEKLESLNEKIADKLSSEELHKTVISSISKKFH